jgi:hypothetical protein
MGPNMTIKALLTAGMPAEYVYRETKRSLDDVKGKCKIYPGIDIDIPTSKGEKETNPEDVHAAIAAALRAGAEGVILSRKYSEMRLANLEGAGRAVREFRGKGRRTAHDLVMAFLCRDCHPTRYTIGIRSPHQKVCPLASLLQGNAYFGCSDGRLFEVDEWAGDPEHIMPNVSVTITVMLSGGRSLHRALLCALR